MVTFELVTHRCEGERVGVEKGRFGILRVSVLLMAVCRVRLGVGE